MIDKSSLLKSQGSLYLEFIPKDGLFHKMLLLSLMGFLTGWCNLLASPACYVVNPEMLIKYYKVLVGMQYTIVGCLEPNMRNC